MEQFGKTERGFGYILVLFLLLIVSATVIVVSFGIRTQTQYTAISQNSSIALTRAEDGIAIAYAKIKSLNGTSWIGNGFVLNSSDGWRIDVSYDTSKKLLTSTATFGQGRYKRQVAMDVSTGSTFSISTDYDIFSGGNIQSNGKGVLNLNGQNLHGETGISLKSQNININSGMLETAPGNKIEPNKNTNYASKTFQDNDLSSISGTSATVSTFFTVFEQLKTQSDGGTMVITVKASDLQDDGSGKKVLKIQFQQNYNTNLDTSKPVTIVFRKESTSVPDYTVLFNGTNSNSLNPPEDNPGNDLGVNFNGPISILSDGALHFVGMNVNIDGVIYTKSPLNWGIHFNNVKNATAGMVVAKTGIKYNNIQGEIGFKDKKVAVQKLNKTLGELSFTNWREL